MTHQGLKFGIFVPPFHRIGENPTLAMERDLELVEWVDALGFDEAWIGEHHSTGWQTIASPELFMAVACERTRHIRLGSGVVSLPYHHPFMVADRMVLLDHLSRGRVMMGVGSGALASDSYMLGIDPATQKDRTDEALGIIIRLMTETAPLSYKSDWFQINEGVLQLRPYQRPHMPITVASIRSPWGLAVAGKYGVGVLSAAVRVKSAKDQPEPSELWTIAEEAAAQHGKEMKRQDWRVSIPVHLAESRREAVEDVRVASGRFIREYSEETAGMNSGIAGPAEKIVDAMIESGSWVVGTPDDCIAGIQRLIERSGGFGTFLVHVTEWTTREKVLHSYELLARYVMPQFQDSVAPLGRSNEWSKKHMQELQAMRTRAVDAAQRAWAEPRVLKEASVGD